MTGARIRVDVLGIDDVQRRLGSLASAGRDLMPVMEDIGEHLVRTTKDRFRDQRDPQGAPWAPLSESTRQRKKRNKDRILTLEGFLGGTIAFRASSDEVLTGSPLNLCRHPPVWRGERELRHHLARFAHSLGRHPGPRIRRPVRR